MDKQIHVGSLNNDKLNAIRISFPNHDIVGADVSSNVPNQPWNLEIEQGAKNRANACRGLGDFCIGIESGLVWSRKDYYYESTCIYIINNNDNNSKCIGQNIFKFQQNTVI